MSIFKEAKYLVYLNFNIIIAFYSSILLAFGIVLQIGEEKGIKTFSRLSIGAFSICVSILDLLIAGCGLWIFAKRKSSVLNYYVIVVLMVFALQVVLGAIALGAFNSGDEVEIAMRELFLNFDRDSVQTVNHIQAKFRCCGVTGPSWWKQYNDKIYPVSCCSEENQPCHDPFERGCTQTYIAAIEKNVLVIGGIAIGFAPVELASAVLAWYIRLSTKNKG